VLEALTLDQILYITIWQYWLGNTKPKKAFRLILNAFKKLYRIFKKCYSMEFSFDWLTNCLPACLMPSDSRNSMMAKATGLIFFAIQRRFSPRGAFCHTAVHTMHSSWTYHSPPLCPIHLCSPWKVSIARDGFHLLQKSSVAATLLQRFFLNSCWVVLLNNGLVTKRFLLDDKYVSGACCTIVSM